MELPTLSSVWLSYSQVILAKGFPASSELGNAPFRNLSLAFEENGDSLCHITAGRHTTTCTTCTDNALRE